MEIAFPLVRKCWATRRSALLRSRLGNAELRPPFELDDEYEVVMYRQFVVLIASTTSPLVPIITLLANVFEILIDRAKLVHVLAKPPKLNVFSMYSLTILGLAGWIVAVFAPPEGVLWVLASDRLLEDGGFYADCALFSSQASNGTLLRQN